MFGMEKLFKSKAPEATKEESTVSVMPQETPRHPVQDPTTGEVIGSAGSPAEEMELIQRYSEEMREAA